MRLRTIAAALVVATPLLALESAPAAACDWGYGYGGYGYAAPSAYGYYGYAAPAYGYYGYAAPAYGNYGYAAPAYGNYGYAAPAYGNYGYAAPAYGNYGYAAPPMATTATPHPPMATTATPHPPMATTATPRLVDMAMQLPTVTMDRGDTMAGPSIGPASRVGPPGVEGVGGGERLNRCQCASVSAARTCWSAISWLLPARKGGEICDWSRTRRRTWRVRPPAVTHLLQYCGCPMIGSGGSAGSGATCSSTPRHNGSAQGHRCHLTPKRLP